MIIVGFAILVGIGIFATLCCAAPIWDEDRQMSAEDVSAAAERA